MTNSSVHALLWYTLGKVPKSLWELVQLYPSVTPLRTAVCKEMLFASSSFWSVSPAIPRICFARVSKVRAVSYPSSEVTAVQKCSAPRQSTVDWLWLPRETHSPHNNELLRLPEDTAPVRRIEIKRQVREVRRTSEEDEEEEGEGGGGGRWLWEERQIREVMNLAYGRRETRCSPGRGKRFLHGVQMFCQSAPHGN